MKSVLHKCNFQDFEYLSTILDSYMAFTDDSGRNKLIGEVFGKRFSHRRPTLEALIDKQIRYYGSSDIAYLYRSIFRSDGGVSSLELIRDVASKLKIKLKQSNSVESLLERLAVAVVDRELASKSSKELIASFKDMGLDNYHLSLLEEHLKTSGTAIALPVLLRVLGPQLTMKIIEGIILSILAMIIGRTAAQQVLKEILKKNPMLNFLGPIVWGVSASWLAFDLQGPAYRKTIPICLYLGIVCLRDGLEED